MVSETVEWSHPALPEDDDSRLERWIVDQIDMHGNDASTKMLKHPHYSKGQRDAALCRLMEQGLVRRGKFWNWHLGKRLTLV